MKLDRPDCRIERVREIVASAQPLSDRRIAPVLGASRFLGSGMLLASTSVMHGSRILVADDDPDVLDVVSSALEEMGALVIRAENGGELIESIADQGPFDLVVTDVSMPWMSGLQAMHSARTAGIGAPIIVMTALRDDRLLDHVRALGENAVLLQKPFKVDEMEAAVSKLLSVQRGS